MNNYDIFTVVYRNDLDNIKNQIKSIFKFSDPCDLNNIVIVINLSLIHI